MNEYGIKKERKISETTVSLDMQLLLPVTIASIVEDLTEEIYYQREENSKLKSSIKTDDERVVKSL